MKIKWLLAFCFCTNLMPAWANSSQNSWLKKSGIDFYVGGEADGFKLYLPLVEFRFYESKDSLQNFGIAFSSENFVPAVPIIIKSGNLTPGGLYTKMKNPLLNSSLSPFGSVSNEASCVTATLPSYSSFNHPESFFLQCGFKSSKSLLRAVFLSYWNCDLLEEEVLSFKIKLSPFKKCSLSLSGCSGYFNFNEFSSSSWFFEDLYYHEGIHFCSVEQFSLVLPKITNLFTLTQFETPFGTVENLFRNESKIKSNHFIFTFSEAFAPNQVITSDGSILRPSLQLKGGMQYQFVAGEKLPVFLKTGTSAYCKINLGEQKHSLKLAAGIQGSIPVSSLSLTIGASNVLTTPSAGTSQIKFDSGTIKLKNTWYFKSFCPAITYSKSFNPADDYTFLTTTDSIEFNYAFNQNPQAIISDKYKISFTRKTGAPVKTVFTNSVSIKTAIKRVSCLFKFSVALE